jgi:PAS domain S-box-containing protein
MSLTNPRPAAVFEEAASWFHRLADAMPVIVWTANAEGRLDFVNVRGREYTGQNEPANFVRAVHVEDLPELREDWLAALPRAEPHEARCRLRRAHDGAWRWHSARVVPVLDTSGRPRIWIATVTDDHEVRALVQVNQELIASEQRARRQADEAGRLKDEFIGTLAHELRTPLNAIAGWSNLLKRGLDSDETARALQVIERNVQVQRQLIDDLLDASRIISGHVRLDLHPVHLADVIRRAVDLIRPLAEARRLRIESDLAAEGAAVSGDAARLQQVLSQVLGNAVKFTPPEGRIEVRLREQAGLAQIDVRDTGLGVAPEVLPLFFDRMRQTSVPDARRPGGLGLGLAIVRQLVLMHGGQVDVSSAGTGQGTTVTVSLPMLPLDTSAADARKVAPGSRPAAEVAISLRGLSILIIEDDADSREMLSVLLENVGSVPVAAATVGEGLRLLGDLEIDVVLSDIGMPGRDGFDLIRALRSFPNPRVREAPAVAVTAFARGEDRERILAAGFDAHVGKPVEPRELFAAIAALVRRHHATPRVSPATPGE